MSKSITQDMQYRQSLMQYTAKYGVSRASRKYNKSRSYIYFWKARWDGSSFPCLSVQMPAPPSKPAYGGGTKTHPGYVSQKSYSGHGGTLAPASQTRLHPLPGKLVPGDAQTRDVSTDRKETGLQTKTIRTDAVSRPACAGGCESGASEMPGKPRRTPVSVYRH